MNRSRLVFVGLLSAARGTGRHAPCLKPFAGGTNRSPVARSVRRKSDGFSRTSCPPLQLLGQHPDRDARVLVEGCDDSTILERSSCNVTTCCSSFAKRLVKSPIGVGIGCTDRMSPAEIVARKQDEATAGSRRHQAPGTPPGALHRFPSRKQPQIDSLVHRLSFCTRPIIGQHNKCP